MKFIEQALKSRTFYFSLLAVFLMVTISKLGLNIPRINYLEGLTNMQIISPLPREEDPLKNIKPYLMNKINNFKPVKENTILSQVKAEEEYQQAKSYLIVDLSSGKIIAEKDSDKRLPIASLTKVMTAVVSLDLAKENELFTISKKAVNTDPTNLGVVEGQKMTVEELLNGLLLTSANDAAQILMEGINEKYDKDIFIASMNAKAELLGLNNTHFKNPQGFDEIGQFSSSYDLAILTKYALDNYPTIKSIVSKDYQFYEKNENHKQYDLYNWNGLLGVYPGIYGVKIGNTNDAGKTIIVVSRRSDHDLLVVLLGAPSVKERDLWAAKLLDLGFEKAYGLKPVTITEKRLVTKYQSWKYFY